MKANVRNAPVLIGARNTYITAQKPSAKRNILTANDFEKVL